MSRYHQNPIKHINQVHLRVEDLERSLGFYKQIIGFQVLERSENKVVLTADGETPLLIIEQPESVIPKPNRTTGLFHFALLLPHRKDLGKVLVNILENRYPIKGGSDHDVSEALYLSDPDGNGIEIYVDKPSDIWKWNNGEVLMTTEALDADGLLDEVQGETWQGLPKETVMGHIHLHVSELEKTKEFYCDGLGFDISNSQYGTQVIFVSSGKYHHHIGLNVWNGKGIPAPPKNSVGLENFTVVYPNDKEIEEVISNLRGLGYEVEEKNGVYLTVDPSGNTIRLKS